MPYVIRRTRDGKFVTRPGSSHAYTPLLQNAMTFATRENAENQTCGNEYVVSIEDVVREE